ncbi:hypothetical protein BJX76DRAFT_341128 [Aspergillus varians]
MPTKPSLIFHQGLRCTKVPRNPRATEPLIASTKADNPASTTNPPFFTAGKSAVDPASSLEISAGRSTSSEEITFTNTAPATRRASESETGPSSSSETATQRSESDSPGLDVRINTTSTYHSATHTLFPTETSTAAQATTPSSQLIASMSDNTSTGPPYAIIFGTLFGALGFIALTATILVLHRRRSRKRSASLQDDRTTADSRRGLRQDFQSDFRSPTPYLSGPVLTTNSTLTTTTPYPEKHHTQTQTQNQILPSYSDYLKPLSEKAEGSNSSAPLAPFPMSDSQGQGRARLTELYTANASRNSVISGTSLGSTLILPGRNSMGSECQGSRPSFPRAASSGSS